MKNEKLNLTPKRNKNLTELKKKYDLNENSFKKMPTRYSVLPNFIFPPKKKKRDYKNDDLEILNHSKNIDGIINNGEELFNIPFEITEKEGNLMKYCISKRRNLRKKEENIFIAHYISTFKNYRKIIINKDERFIDPNEFLIRISQNLIQENIKSFNLINRFGDKNEKFFMILEGKISVLSIKEKVYKMNEIEYINHLKFLLEIKENELVNKILEKNDKIFDTENIKKILKGEIDLNEEQKNLINEHEKLSDFDISHVIPKQYIKRFIPELISEGDYDKKDVTLFVYEKTNELSNGETFGESVLINDLIMKNTYITTEETILLFLHRKIFEKCEREAQFKLRKNNIEVILHNELFKRMNSEIFDKKYFDLFKILQKKQGNILFSQGEERKEIFFIKKGTINITANLNYNELNKIIIEKGGILDEKLEQKMLKKNLNLPENLLSFQNIYQIFQINNNEILGMDDYVLTKKNKFFCNAIVTSKYLDLYSIDLNLFNEMCQNDFRIYEIFDNYLNKRNEIMVERLIHLKKVLLNKEIERISRNKQNVKNSEINVENIEIHEKKNENFSIKSNLNVNNFSDKIKKSNLIILNPQQKNIFKKKFKYLKPFDFEHKNNIVNSKIKNLDFYEFNSIDNVNEFLLKNRLKKKKFNIDFSKIKNDTNKEFFNDSSYILNQSNFSPNNNKSKISIFPPINSSRITNYNNSSINYNKNFGKRKLHKNLILNFLKKPQIENVLIKNPPLLKFGKIQEKEKNNINLAYNKILNTDSNRYNNNSKKILCSQVDFLTVEKILENVKNNTIFNNYKKNKIQLKKLI